MNRHLSLDRDGIRGLISEHVRKLIWIYNVCGVKDERAWDIFYDIIFSWCSHDSPHFTIPAEVTTLREQEFAFSGVVSNILLIYGANVSQTRDQMNNSRWDNPYAFRDQVDHSNPLTASSGRVKPTGKHFSLYCSDDPRAKIEPPSCQQYKPGDFLAVWPLNWDEQIDDEDDDEIWADSGAPSSVSSRPGDGNDNDNGEGEADTQGGEKWTGKGNGTKDGHGKGKVTEDWKGNGKGHGKGKGIVKQTTGGDDISCAVTLQLQKEMYEADWDTEG